MLTSDEQTDTGRREAEIAAMVRRYVVDEFLFGTGEVDDRASLLESGTIDSTGIVELAMWLEVHFGIEIDDEDMTTANLDSVERIAHFVARGEAASAPGDRRIE
jgi:acyl carrier protein